MPGLVPVLLDPELLDRELLLVEPEPLLDREPLLVEPEPLLLEPDVPLI
jgi:hypothetical protein